MIDFIQYLEEPKPYIVRESIMNFELNTVIQYLDRRGIVIGIFDKNIRIQMNEGDIHIVHYTDLKVISAPYVTPEKEGLFWSEISIDYLRQNMSVHSKILAQTLGRSETAINNQKHLIRTHAK